MAEPLILRPAVVGDAGAIAAIYAHYVLNSVITFEVDPPSAEDMSGRMASLLPHYPYFVAESGGVVVGYAYAGRLYERAAYRWAVESTVYLAPDRQREGIGGALYRKLIEALTLQGFQTVIGKITLPNPASTSLHERLGFTCNGVLSRVGFKADGWHDVGLYQLDLGSRPSSPEETTPFAA